MTPLAGLRILTFEVFGAGPYGSMFFADLGAEVIKIENAATGGDPARHVGPHMLGPGQSQYYQTWNTNKKSVDLDLKSEPGRRDFERLVQSVATRERGDFMSLERQEGPEQLHVVRVVLYNQNSGHRSLSSTSRGGVPP